MTKFFNEVTKRYKVDKKRILTDINEKVNRRSICKLSSIHFFIKYFEETITVIQVGQFWWKLNDFFIFKLFLIIYRIFRVLLKYSIIFIIEICSFFFFKFLKKLYEPIDKTDDDLDLTKFLSNENNK